MSEEQSIREIRLQKLARMRELGHDPYQVEKFEFDKSATQLLEGFVEGEAVRFAGRLIGQRLMGKASFCHLSDGDAKIQIYLKKDDLGDTAWELAQLLDIGDHVGVEGELFVTKTGEKSIHVRQLTPLSKSLQVLPLGKEKDGHHWYGLSDTEQRYRHRHLDLICNPDARKLLLDRMKIVRAVRHYFDSVGYLEVETPMLQIEAGGAAARTFSTYYNAYEMEVKLRISLELYLKRVLCGDVPRVYEIGRVFRNEGLSNRHNPEFTLLEFYEAYGNLETMMERVEGVFRQVALDVFGSTEVSVPLTEGESLKLDFGKPWARVDLMGAICERTGMALDDFATIEKALAAAEAKDIPGQAKALNAWVDLKKENNLGGFIEKLLEVFVEPTLIQPTFLIGYPIETSPLAKKDFQRPGFTRRFEGYIRGREVCNAFSEINDPIDQRERFEQQVKERAKGDDEAHPMDEDFLFALEGGMPPTGGCGIGIDRMAMMLTGADHIREVLLFPMMKPDDR